MGYFSFIIWGIFRRIVQPPKTIRGQPIGLCASNVYNHIKRWRHETEGANQKTRKQRLVEGTIRRQPYYLHQREMVRADTATQRNQRDNSKGNSQKSGVEISPAERTGEKMKTAYPIVLTPVEEMYAVTIPDLDISTQGADIAEAMYMARDAIGMWICYEQDEGRSIPLPSNITKIKTNSGETKTLVDIDIEEYRRAHDNRTIRKNLTLPSWLNERAESAGINFSQTLQKALKQQLGIQE